MGAFGYSGDGGLATEASLDSLWGVTVDTVGNLYIVDSGNNRIRKVDTQGIISTVAGNGAFGYSGDGGLATEASLYHLRGVTVDTVGNLYIADTSNNRIRKVDTQGIISTVAGNGVYGFNGDGKFATGASLRRTTDVTVDTAGNLYITDTDNNRIRKVDTQGIISTVAGNGSAIYSGDGGLATEASLDSPWAVTVDTVGNLYIADTGAKRIRKILKSLIFQTYNLNLNQSIYKNQNNTADIFDTTGKHLKLIDLSTGNALKTFTYDDNNHLETITDRFAQSTTITRDANGNPTQITAPNGQTTTLTIDEQGNLTQVSYEDNSKYEFSYFDGSLMNIMTDPNGNTIQHGWNDTGRIVEEIDGEGGSYQFLRDVTGNETFYSTILPEGETSTSADVTLANGDTHSTMTLATGETVTATFAKDESSTTSLRDGVSTSTTYTTDSLTHQKILSSKETTQPSGLKNTSTYTTTYDGNETHTNTKTQTITTNTKTQTITTNTKTTTLVTDYNTGTSTLTTPTGRTATSTYDVNTLLTSQSSTGTLTPTTYTYDSKGRTTKELTGTREITYTYDSKGNLATVTNPRGETTSYAYDIVDNLTTVNYPNGTSENFSYDKNGNLLTRTVPTPTDHTFTYNGTDNRAGYTSPLNYNEPRKSKHLIYISYFK